MKKAISLISILLILSIVLCGCDFSSDESKDRKKKTDKEITEEQAEVEEKDHFYSVEGLEFHTNVYFNNIGSDLYGALGVHENRLCLFDDDRNILREINATVIDYTDSDVDADYDYSPEHFELVCEEVENLDDEFVYEIRESLQGTPLLIAKEIDCNRAIIHTYTDSQYYDIEVILYEDDRETFDELCEDIALMTFTETQY